MKIVFSLFGRPDELRFCLQSLQLCKEVDQWEIDIDINDESNEANTEVNQIVDTFIQSSPLKVSCHKHADGNGADRNIFRTLSRYNERVLYCAGDVLFHPEALVQYRLVNDRFSPFPVTLYHSFAHKVIYKKDYAILKSTAFESLLFNPAEYFDHILFHPKIISGGFNTDWILSYLFARRHHPICSTQLSYIQHLGVQGGTTSGRFPPRYSKDYIDQATYISILQKLGVDLNLINLAR